VLKDGDLAFTASAFGPNYRYSATFQVAAPLRYISAYSRIKDISTGAFSGLGDTLTASFDVSLSDWDETDVRPRLPCRPLRGLSGYRYLSLVNISLHKKLWLKVWKLTAAWVGAVLRGGIHFEPVQCAVRTV